jgi:hypothetical protein
MTIAEILTVCSNEATLPFLAIGDLAVIAHGYPRDTVDLDYLVRQSVWSQRNQDMLPTNRFVP